jgi:glycosyltransferase involved in cell wall biosynthesis
MSPPLISIVTPSYNQAEYLEETIRSVQEQDYPHVEHIVIDGDSDDDSADILRAYDDNLAYWVSEPDRGQSHAINKGLEQATGDILAYLNSDDFYLPGTFEAVAELYRESPEAGLLHGRCRYVNEQGEKVGSQYGQFESVADLLDLWEVWWSEQQVVQPEVFWTRDVYERVGGFREDLNYVMDYDYWLRTLLEGFDLVRVDREFTAFRFQPNQKSEESEAVASELLNCVRPYLWGKASLPLPTRIYLQGQWLHHACFLPAVERSLEKGQSKHQRWKMLLRLTAQHPQIVFSRGFRHRLYSILTSITSKS